MLTRPPTPAELVATFNQVLDDVVSGTLHACPSDTGLDPETVAVLDALAVHPKTARDIVACRTEFARQLDGTHIREAEANEARFWDEYARSAGSPT